MQKVLIGVRFNRMVL